MPVHDWSRADTGIFHDFHGELIRAIKWSLNHGLLPEGYYASMEQRAAGVEADVIALQGEPNAEVIGAGVRPASSGQTGLLLEPPAVQLTAEADQDYYRRITSA